MGLIRLAVWLLVLSAATSMGATVLHPTSSDGYATSQPPVSEHLNLRNSQEEESEGLASLPVAQVQEEGAAPAPPVPASNHRRRTGGQLQVNTAGRRNPPRLDRPTPVPFGPHVAQWVLPVAYSRAHLGGDMDHTILNDLVYNLTAGEEGVIAVKDSVIQACFIDKYKLPFVLPRQQRRFYTHTMSGMILDSPVDRRAFKKLVGKTIYDLCHHLRTFWLDHRLQNLYVKTANDLSPSSPANNSQPRLRKQQLSTMQELFDDVVKRPPPVSLYHALRQLTYRGPPRHLTTLRHSPSPSGLYYTSLP